MLEVSGSWLSGFLTSKRLLNFCVQGILLMKDPTTQSRQLVFSRWVPSFVKLPGDKKRTEGHAG